MIKAFLLGIRSGLRLWRIGLLAYLLQFLVAFAFGMQVFSVLDSGIGDSLMLDRLGKGFDYSVVYDFLNYNGGAYATLIGQLKWVLIGYFLASTFINGGILKAICDDRLSVTAFFHGGISIFLPFLGMGLFFLLCTLVWSIIIWVPFFSSVFWMLRNLPSEKVLFIFLFLLILLYALGLVVLFSWSVLARIKYLRAGFSVIQSIWRGLRSYFRNLFSITGLVLLFGVVQLLVTAFYWNLDQPGLGSSLGILLSVFILQQVFVIFRVFWRMMVYSGVLGYAKDLTAIQNNDQPLNDSDSSN